MAVECRPSRNSMTRVYPQCRRHLSVEPTRSVLWGVVARLVVFPWSLIAKLIVRNQNTFK